MAVALVGAPRPTHPGLPPAVTANHELLALVALLDPDDQPQTPLSAPDRHAVRLAVAPHAVRLAVDPSAVHPLHGPVAVRRDDRLGGPGQALRLVALAAPETASPDMALADAADANPLAVKNMSAETAQPAPSALAIQTVAMTAPEPALPAPAGPAAPVAAPGVAPGRSILVAGDSLSIFLADALRPLVAGRPGAAFAARGKVSSGLARPDFFNWEREMADLAHTRRPDTVVVMIATNDNQTLTRPDGRKIAFGRPGWNEEYGRRVRRLVDLARQGNPEARVYWIGAPVMADPQLNADVAAINEVIAREIAALPGCRFVDVSRTLADASGRYAPALPAPGGPRVARTRDGVHLTSYGAKLLAHAALASMSPAVAALERR